MRTIWIEWFLFENIIGNLAIFWGASRWLGVEARLLRLISAAALGAGYALTEECLGGISALTPIKLAVSAVMVLIAYGAGTPKLFLLRLLCFYAVTFMFGGGAIAIGYLCGLQSPGIVLAALIICALMLERLLRFNNTKSCRECARIKLEAEQGFESYINALIDTGNSLKEPISSKPVLLVQKDALNLSAGLIAALNKPQDEPGVMLERRIRLIPYRVLGERRGVLSAFEPKGAYVMEDGWSRRECYVALVDDKLSENGDFEAIAPSSFSAGVGRI